MSELLRECSRGGHRFTLRVEGGLPKTKIVIHGQGDLIESVEQPGRPKHTLLGERLRRAGLIDATQLRNALKGQKRQLVPIGEALLNEGLITQSDLDKCARPASE